MGVHQPGSGGGGGGSQPGAAIVRGPFTFNHTQATALAAGVAFYTPTIGDALLDAWVEIDRPWAGSAAQLDFGPFVGSNSGLWNNTYGEALALLAVAADTYPNPPQGQMPPLSLTMALNAVTATQQIQVSGTNIVGVFPATGWQNAARCVPLVMTTADPLLCVVSQNGSKGGTPVSSSAGIARLYVVTATPAAFS